MPAKKGKSKPLKFSSESKSSWLFYIILSIIVAIGVACLIYAAFFNNSDEQLIGGDKDEHGCLIGAGYSYCPSSEKCMRMWEDYCEEFKENFRGAENPELIDSFVDCMHSGYPVMESYPRQCNANNQTFVEDIK